MSSGSSIAIANGYNAFYTSVVDEINTLLQQRELLSNDVEMCLKAMVRFQTQNTEKSKDKRVFRMSGYHLYMSESAKQMKLKNPNMNPKEVTTMVSKEWRTLSEEKKNEYKTRAIDINSDAIKCN